jgi:hypothetical protein
MWRLILTVYYNIATSVPKSRDQKGFRDQNLSPRPSPEGLEIRIVQ